MEQGNLLHSGDDPGGRLTRDEIVRRLVRGQGRGLRSDVAIARALGADPMDEPGMGASHGRPAGGRALRPASVLVPLVAYDSGLSVILTERTEHLANHAGQVSFPGGRLEDHDDGPVACALRETEEETGLPRDKVDVLGFLDEYVTVTGFSVTPVVGLVTPPVTLDPDPFEVAEVFEVPLAFILDPANHKKVARVVNGRSRPYYAMPYGDHYIWGATAGMLMNLYRVLKD